jgi:hypothetical protein
MATTAGTTIATDNFRKVVRLGTARTYNNRAYSIYCEIEYENGRLSISGVEGPTRGGNAIGGCGQIDNHLRDELHTITPAPGWDALKLRQFFNVWQRWHLNDLNAGSQVQETYLRENPIPKEDYAYPKSHYEVASKVLAEAGLNPDADGYLYGHGWKREEVPVEVLEFLRGLPDTDREPAWV